MNQLQNKLFAEINELRNRSAVEVRAILQARTDLKDSFDYMLQLVMRRYREEEHEFRMIKAYNPELDEEFVRVNLQCTGYPMLIEVLEGLSSKCRSQREKIYWDKADKQFVNYKDAFLKKFQASGDKPRLLAGEIKAYEDLFGGGKIGLLAENDEMKFGDKSFKVEQVRVYRKLYQKLIVNGDRDYSVTKIFDSGIGGSVTDFYHIRVEALYKYLNWLLENMPTNDTRYLVRKETLLNDFDYKTVSAQIESHGSYIINSSTIKGRIYSAELTLILISEKLEVKNLDTKKTEVIRGFQFIDSYLEGFREGEVYFKNTFATPTDILYGKGRESYIGDLHHNYYHHPSGSHEGWVYVKSVFPQIITRKAIKEFGFYSGLVDQVDTLIGRFPAAFKDFSHCAHKGIINEKEEEKRVETLLDIWLPDKVGSKDFYYEYVEFLKTENPAISSPFLTEINGQLRWNKTPQKGWVQYLAGFVYTCIKKKWVADVHSAPVLKKILERTFNITFNATPFKQLSANPPKDPYLTPFSNLRANI